MGTNRNYKLTPNQIFIVFEDYLNCELKTKRLHYILKTEDHSKVNSNKLTQEKHKVRDIIINHIELNYYSKITELIEPIEIIDKLKESKKLESRTTRLSARNDLNSLRYNRDKQTVAEFWNLFEEKVQIYESTPRAKLTELEKKDLFV